MIKRENIGRREEQQDSHFAAERKGVSFAMVADGLGGMQGGAIASNCIKEMARKMFSQSDIDHSNARRFLEGLKEAAHNSIVEKSRELGINARSTITAMLVIDTKAYLLHSGDSRIYHFNKNTFKNRTKDHSLVQILVDRNKVREEDMGTHPDQGKLYNCLGGESGYDSDFSVVDLEAGDWFLLCTDGFWEHLSLRELASLYPENEDRANTLLLQAVVNGGENCDNVTFVAVFPSFKSSIVDFLKKNILVLSVFFTLIILSLLLCLTLVNLLKTETLEDSLANSKVEPKVELKVELDPKVDPKPFKTPKPPKEASPKELKPKPSHRGGIGSILNNSDTEGEAISKFKQPNPDAPELDPTIVDTLIDKAKQSVESENEDMPEDKSVDEDDKLR